MSQLNNENEEISYTTADDVNLSYGKVAASSVGDPYKTENEEVVERVTAESGRISVVLANEKQYRDDYDGPPNKKCAARAGEIAADDNGNLGVFISVGKHLKWVSVTKELVKIVENLEDLGVLSNARAFAANSNINNLIFDNVRKIVNLNPNKLFRRQIRYYAIKSNEANDNGEYEWITGVTQTGADGSLQIVTPLVDMNSTVRVINGETVMLSEPLQGGLLRDMVDGEVYTVLFYDAERRLIGQEQYQASSVASQSGLLAPNTAVTDLVIESSRIGPEDDSTYLYVGESAANLSLRVFVKYADGRTMEVTSESFGNGRLVIEGLDSINTEYPTDDVKSPYELTIKYYLLDTNAETSSNSISKSFKVYVKEDVFDNIVAITPAGIIDGEHNLPTTKVRLKLYGLYQSGTVRDITPMTKAADRLIGYDNAVYNSAKDTWDAANTIINTGSHNVIVRIPQGTSGALKTFNFDYETSTAHRRFIVNGRTTKFINFNAYTGTMSFEENVTSNSLAIENEFINTDGSKVTPTHFSIRSAINPKALFADKISLDNIRGFSFDTATGYQPFTDMPLIIEFSRLTEGGDGVTTSVFITSAALYYAKQAN